MPFLARPLMHLITINIAKNKISGIMEPNGAFDELKTLGEFFEN
ncbi:hypothetical protein TRIP_E280338 [uncultured Spirochaetota bacterium]|nr:hypothetical protein TRIP_E280338 [uncultured Spirochaetota bacterium]